MLISKDKKFIFIHIKKAAGSSITRSLAKYDDRNMLLKILNTKVLTRISAIKRRNPLSHHVSAAQVKNYLGTEYDRYYKFAFVRNPFDWQISNYFFIKQRWAHPRHKEVKNLSYIEYLNWTLENRRIVPQLHFITESGNPGKIIVDYVGKIENIEHDFKYILKQLDLENEVILPHANKSMRNSEYRQYYDDQTREFIEHHYNNDLKTFEYSF